MATIDRSGKTPAHCCSAAALAGTDATEAAAAAAAALRLRTARRARASRREAELLETAVKPERQLESERRWQPVAVAASGRVSSRGSRAHYAEGARRAATVADS